MQKWIKYISENKKDTVKYKICAAIQIILGFKLHEEEFNIWNKDVESNMQYE